MGCGDDVVPGAERDRTSGAGRRASRPTGGALRGPAQRRDSAATDGREQRAAPSAYGRTDAARTAQSYSGVGQMPRTTIAAESP